MRDPQKHRDYMRSYYHRDGKAAVARAATTKRRNLNQERLNSLKSHPCMDCNGIFPAECMDFDHRPGELKLFGLGNGRYRAWSQVLAEIAKCDLVCANCHRIRSATRLRKEAA